MITALLSAVCHGASSTPPRNTLPGTAFLEPPPGSLSLAPGGWLQPIILVHRSCVSQHRTADFSHFMEDTRMPIVQQNSAHLPEDMPACSRLQPLDRRHTNKQQTSPTLQMTHDHNTSDFSHFTEDTHYRTADFSSLNSRHRIVQQNSSTWQRTHHIVQQTSANSTEYIE